VVFNLDVIFSEQKIGLEDSTQREPKKFVCLEYSDEPLDNTNVPEPPLLSMKENKLNFMDKDVL